MCGGRGEGVDIAFKMRHISDIGNYIHGCKGTGNAQKKKVF